MAFWDKISTRGNVEDRRSMGPGLPGLALGGGGLGLGGIVLMLALNYFMGGNLGGALNDVLQQVPQQQFSQQTLEKSDNYDVFASTVLGSTDDYWTSTFNKINKTYKKPQLILFRNATSGGCGTSSSAVGPHYCPLDGRIYLDETFFDQLQSQFGGSKGDVAQAYVIAHEVGHHVQNQLGLLQRSGGFDMFQNQNEQSVKQELQADCFAGLWAQSIRDKGVFENDQEITEALEAASAVGDDNIQAKSQGYVSPESWTHGSSEQRMNAFKTGYDTGDFNQCKRIN